MILIWAVAVRKRPSWLGSRALVALGEASYATYILHAPALIFLAHTYDMAASGLLGTHGPRHEGIIASSALYFVMQVFVVIALSLAACRFVDARCRRWVLSKWLGSADNITARQPFAATARLQNRPGRLRQELML